MVLRGSDCNGQKGSGVYLEGVIVREHKGSGVYLEGVIVRDRRALVCT